MNKKALIAMSGGVDSSVAALLMLQAGYRCLGATMRLYRNEDAGLPREKTCCSLDDIEDAREVAVMLGIPYYVFNFSDDFKAAVIRRFAAEYHAGGTPNPCIDCNRFMKFSKLYERAKLLGCSVLATGHYAQIERESDRYLLKKGADASKDQSYVLYFLSQDQLAHTAFPLGSMSKAEIRQIAREHRFVNAQKRESQDICFVPDGDYAKVIQVHSSQPVPAGDFVDLRGNKIGTHRGLIHYTIGQRRGLGLALKEPAYVVAKDPSRNAVVLGSERDLFSRHLDAADFNWIAYEKPPETLRAKAKIRYGQREQAATVTPTSPDTIHLEFDEPQRAIARGQAVVLYDGDVVLGGGTIR